ncbi:interleukin-17 receptor C-like [Polyodon spathula]|uniref:interleukin-17 receptor C-like n=1 Tax=Polyodon spathula TaxID=7913 RepID=UPI001B7DD525|nr:interleukin-17 receptor C-like [Polyodon spathula]
MECLRVPILISTLLLTFGLSPVLSNGVWSEHLVKTHDAHKSPTVTCTQGLSCSVEVLSKLSPPGSVLSPPSSVLLPILMDSETLLCCQRDGDCQPCLRVRISMSITGPPGAEGEGSGGAGLDDAFSDDSDLEQDEEVEGEEGDSGLRRGSVPPEPSHTAPLRATVMVCVVTPPSTGQWLRVTLTSNSTAPGPVGTVQLDSVPVPVGSEVRLTALSQYQGSSFELIHSVPGCSHRDLQRTVKRCAVPTVNTTIDWERGVAKLRLDGTDRSHTHAMVCLMQRIGERCQASWRLNHTQVQHIPFRDITPCLCFQYYWCGIHDAVRRQSCPFSNHTEFQENVWRNSSLTVTRTVTLLHGTALSWLFTAPCRVEAEVWLCWWSGKGGSECREIQGSRKRLEKQGEFLNVDPHPSLCVQAQVPGMGQILDHQCPFAASDPQWTVNPSLRGQTLTVKLSHNSTPVSLCKRTGPNCTLVNTSQTGYWELQLHDPGSSDCLEAWRTDVSFSPRVLICPADLAHRWRWTLPLLLCLVLLSLGVLTAVLLRRSFNNWIQRVWKRRASFKGTLGGGPVLLLYPLEESVSLPVLVSSLGSCLADLGFSVSLDLWSRTELCSLGPVPWLHSRLAQLQQDGGKAVLILTQGAWEQAERWVQHPGSRTRQIQNSSDPCLDVFSASLSCILADFLQGRAGERFVLAQFETPLLRVFKHEGLPEIFKGIPLYSLPSQSLAFLTELSAVPRNSGTSRGRRADSLRAASRELTGRLAWRLKEVQRGAQQESGDWVSWGEECRRSQYSTDSGVGGTEEMWESVPLQPNEYRPQGRETSLAHWV